MQAIVYTAYIGPAYRVFEPTVKNKNWRHICFTTENITSKSWEIVRVKKHEDLTFVKFARFIKLHPHVYLGKDESDISLWIDSKFTITSDLDEFAGRYLIRPNVDMMIMDHNRRNCIYDEQKVLAKDFAGQPNVVADVNKQIDAYRKAGMPEKFGLFSSGIMLRWHNRPNVIKLDQLWWDEVLKYSQRDMISIPYILWKNPLLVKIHLANFHKTYERFMNRK